MLVEVEKQHHCAACRRPIESDWLICPHCRTRLRRVCSSCGRLVEADWALCAYCGKDFERPDYTRTPVRVPAGRAACSVNAFFTQRTSTPACNRFSVSWAARSGNGSAAVPLPSQPR